MKPPVLILTCEHAGKRIPSQWRHKVMIPEAILNSHRGWDPGAWTLAQALKACGTEHLFGHHESRLLIELNRSLHHPHLFSEFSKPLAQADKLKLIHALYEPYRRDVTETIRSFIRQRRPVWHVSVHSFTPVLHGIERQAEIGLLYDPQRSGEKAFCSDWRALLQRETIDIPMRVRMNYPYKGIMDGFVTSLRKIFSNSYYVGTELEVNQGLLSSAKTRQPVTAALVRSLKSLVEGKGLT